MNLAMILAMRPQVINLECQVRFDWQCRESGKRKNHFFDFRATLVDGTRVAVMVKQSRKLFCPEFCALRDSVAAAMMPQFADRLIVLTEQHADPIELHNATYLDSLKERDREADAAVRRSIGMIQGSRAISAIVRDAGLAAARGFRAVGGLLRHGELALTKLERIGMETVVRPTERFGLHVTTTPVRESLA